MKGIGGRGWTRRSRDPYKDISKRRPPTFQDATPPPIFRRVKEGVSPLQWDSPRVAEMTARNQTKCRECSGAILPRQTCYQVPLAGGGGRRASVCERCWEKHRSKPAE